MNNKAILAGLATLLVGFTAAADAGNRNGRDQDYDRHRDRGERRARVVQVEPLYERVRYTVPVEHCWNERDRRGSGIDRRGAAIAGGVVGAVVGHQIGDGKGIATVAGAIAGAAIGNELGQDGRRDARHRDARRCEVRRENRVENRVVAYRVTYMDRGRREVTRLPYDPGRFVYLDDIRRRG